MNSSAIKQIKFTLIPSLVKEKNLIKVEYANFNLLIEAIFFTDGTDLTCLVNHAIKYAKEEKNILYQMYLGWGLKSRRKAMAHLTNWAIKNIGSLYIIQTYEEDLA